MGSASVECKINDTSSVTCPFQCCARKALIVLDLPDSGCSEDRAVPDPTGHPDPAVLPHAIDGSDATGYPGPTGYHDPVALPHVVGGPDVTVDPDAIGRALAHLEDEAEADL